MPAHAHELELLYSAVAVASGSKISAAANRVAVVAPLSTFTCPLRFGARSLQQSFLNRHDYARMHSFDFNLYPVSRAQALNGTWYRFEALQQARITACTASASRGELSLPHRQQVAGGEHFLGP